MEMPLRHIPLADRTRRARVLVPALLCAAALTACGGQARHGPPGPVAPGAGAAPAAPVAQATDRCGPNTWATVSDEVGRAASHIYGEEHFGGQVRQAVTSLQSSRALASSVAHGDPAGARSAIVALLSNHEHIVRIRTLRAGRVLSDVGGPQILAPISGPLRLGRRAVGRFVLSVQDDLGYFLLARRLLGVPVFMRTPAGQVRGSANPGPATIPTRGLVSFGGRTYMAHSFRAVAFPSGPLRISVLVAPPASPMRSLSCRDVAVQTAGAIARRVYGESASGPNARLAQTSVQQSTALSRATAAGDAAAARRAIDALIAQRHVDGVSVTRDGHVLAQFGGKLLAPSHGAIVTPSGAIAGRYSVSVLNTHGYVILMHALLGADVVIRHGTQTVEASLNPAPRRIPALGEIAYHSVAYSALSFTGIGFPDRPLRISLLLPASALRATARR